MKTTVTAYNQNTLTQAISSLRYLIAMLLRLKIHYLQFPSRAFLKQTLSKLSMNKPPNQKYFHNHLFCCKMNT